MEEVPSVPASSGRVIDLSRQDKIFTLAGIMLAMFLAALDQTIVSTAGPVIRKDLALPDEHYAWMTTAYMVASTVFIPIWGKLSDNLGRKRVLLSGMIVFLLGSVACAVAPTWQVLLPARGLQGLGSAALFTTAFAVIADLFPPAVRGKYTGIFGAVWALAGVLGPFLGGLLTEELSWHWVFLINLPLGIVAIGFVAVRMPRLGGGHHRRLDIGGAAALALAVVPLLLGMSLAVGSPEGVIAGKAATHWTDPAVIALLATAAVGVAIFVVVEGRVGDPMLDLRLFGETIFARGCLAVFVVGSSFFAAILFLPLFMQVVLKASPTEAGVSLMPLTLALVVGNVTSGQLVSRLGRYRPLMLGSLVLLVGAYAWVALTLDVTTTATEIKIKAIFIGLALGPSLPLYTLAIQNGMSPHQVGVVTSTVTFFRQIGGTIGVAVAGTVFGSVLSMRAVRDTHLAAARGAHGQHAFVDAIRAVFWLGAGTAALAFLITLTLPELPLRKSNR